jgi:hypothetical protein
VIAAQAFVADTWCSRDEARAWDYIRQDPFRGLVLLGWDSPEQPMFSARDMKRIIGAVDQSFETIFWPSLRLASGVAKFAPWMLDMSIY